MYKHTHTHQRKFGTKFHDHLYRIEIIILRKKAKNKCLCQNFITSAYLRQH